MHIGYEPNWRLYGIVSLEMVAFEHTEDSSLAGQISLNKYSCQLKYLFELNVRRNSSEFDQIMVSGCNDASHSARYQGGMIPVAVPSIRVE